MPLIEPFILPYSAASVEDLQTRLARTRWPDPSPDSSYGFDLPTLINLCAYWKDRFDWKAQIDRLSAFHHYTFKSSIGRIHYIHECGKGPAPIPLILTHGWPGSFAEMLRIIPLLTDPAAHGGDPADSFDVVVPSLPGFGFSDKPAVTGINAHRIADTWVALMDALGYPRFAAQGGDIGASVTTSLGLHHAPNILGLHLNFLPGSYRPYLSPDAVLTEAEQKFTRDTAQWFDQNGAYAHLQGTRPQTAAYALNDSPAGLAAWILEKFREWSDCRGDLANRFSPDELLTNITLYWMTESIASSFRIYRESRNAPFQFSEGQFVQPPCAFAHFPKEISHPPQSWVARSYNLERWTDMPSGGHFAAAEEPALLAADLRTFFRPLRLNSAS